MYVANVYFMKIKLYVMSLYLTDPVAQMVVRLTPDQKVVCSSHTRVILLLEITHIWFYTMKQENSPLQI